jgi:regulator of ribonuclease activity A
MPGFATTDLWDTYGETAPGALQVVGQGWRDFGGNLHFCGPIATLKVHRDNALVRARLSEPGAGRVLVIDGGGDTWCALLGDQLAGLAAQQGWHGVVVNGAVRDSEALRTIPLGVKALDVTPRRAGKQGTGLVDGELAFGGARIVPGAWLYADADGILISTRGRLDT